LTLETRRISVPSTKSTPRRNSWSSKPNRSQIGKVESKLKALGVETLGIVATVPENARLYFKYRPTPLRLAADPEMSTHRAYGLPKPAVTAEFMKDMQTTRIIPTASFPRRCMWGDATGAR
jgi:hypothetical protein